MARITWDELWMEHAKLVSRRSTCARLKVGAVIVQDRHIISSGYNGSISGGVHCIDVGCKIVDGHCVRTIHAEANAILQCAKLGVSSNGTTMYVTHFPCLNCTKLIIQAGIKKICYNEKYRVDPYALHLLASAPVEVLESQCT